MLRTWRMFLAWVLLCLAGWCHAQPVLFLSSDGTGDSFTNNAFNAFNHNPEVQALGGLRDARGQLSSATPNVSLFNGARLVVLTTTYVKIHPNWVNALREVMFTRPDLTFVMFPDGCCEVPSNLAPLVQIIADGTQWPLGTSSFSSAEIRSPLNQNSLYADTFRTLDPLMGGAYSLVTQVPSDNALYLPQGASAPATGTTTSAYGFFVPQKGFNAGQGACLFLTADISGFHSAQSAQHAKIASAFMQAATDTVNGACAKSTRAPDLAVTLHGPDRPGLGSTIPFTIAVHNEGASDSQDGVLDVTLPAGLLLQTASLPSGCSATATGLHCVLPPLPADTGSITLDFEAIAQHVGALSLSAAASEVTDETNLANNEAALTLNVVGPDLAVQLAGPDVVAAGSPATFAATVCNNSDVASQDGLLHLTLPTHWQVDADALPQSCSSSAAGVTCALPPLTALGSCTTFTIPVIPEQSGPTTLGASVESVTGEQQLDNNRAELDVSALAPDLSVTLAGPAEARAGDPLTLTATIRNEGPAASQPTTLHLPLPPGWTAQPLPAGCAVQAEALACTVPALDAGATFELPLPLLPAGNGDVTLTALIQPAPGEGESGNNTATWPLTITPAPADPALQAVPALAPWGAGLLALLLAGLGGRGRRPASGQRQPR